MSFLYAIFPFLVAVFFTISILHLKRFFNLEFEFVLLFVIFYMWTELNLKLAKLRVK